MIPAFYVGAVVIVLAVYALLKREERYAPQSIGGCVVFLAGVAALLAWIIVCAVWIPGAFG